ncbi:hypothetical protein MHTCC0001_25930 [Flavobacteriaceae bacterium MHTCC 0001]
MILKGFREKSNKKFLNKLLSERKVNIDNNPIKSLGVILNYDEINDFNVFNALAARLQVHTTQIKVIGYTFDIKNQDTLWHSCFNEKDFGWKGDIKNIELDSFLDKSFDVLISYYTEAHLELKLMTALSKSQLKIGILQTDLRLNDLIIKTNIKDINTFEDEVVKYLKILNKVKNNE